MNRRLIPPLACALGCARFLSFAGEDYVVFHPAGGGFPLAVHGTPAPLYAGREEYPGVLRALGLFADDIRRVTGKAPLVSHDVPASAPSLVVVGTLGRSRLVDSLVAAGKLDVRGVAGKWEAYLIQEVDHPLAGVSRALVVTGSDRRGTIFALFDISRRMGVSPWYWWADVPAARHETLTIPGGRHTDGPPSVMYRGIFLNDEAPDLTNWVRAKYGNIPPRTNPPVPAGIARYGHEFYERVFELLLRLKANYLWPAMWDNAFNEDDSLNAPLADEYGIVMGTSHQEPMLRAQKEWDRRYLRTLGTWNYALYPDTLNAFWREGVRRNRSYENVVTIGLRGANDTPMAPGGPEANMRLLEQIVGVQRGILAREVSPDLTRVPQLWCLYKEVIDYYEAGMRVPDDVTLLWPDDNWGNIRRLPTPAERERSGGAGVYYHFDYHGGPRSYQWIDTKSIPGVWAEMSRAAEAGAQRIWIVNAGHLKGYELPLEFFMDLAWDTAACSAGTLRSYVARWAAREFGAAHAGAIAAIVARSARYNSRRTPELLSPFTYSLVNYNEAEDVVRDFREIAGSAEAIERSLPPGRRTAFEELVRFPLRACALVNALYVEAGKNSLYARQGRASANASASRVRELFSADTALMGWYNHSLAGGKWNHFMDQPHLGYTTWRDPPVNSLKAIQLEERPVPRPPALGVAVEGSADAWPGSEARPALPPLDRFLSTRRYIDVFNRGSAPFDFSVRAGTPCLRISDNGGRLARDRRIWVSVDWSHARPADTACFVDVTGAGSSVRVRVGLERDDGVELSRIRGFLETDRTVSIEAAHFAQNTPSHGGRWTAVEDFGRTLSGMRAEGFAADTSGRGASLQYELYLTDTGRVDIAGIFSPALSVVPGTPLRYGIAVDGDAPEIVTLVPAKYRAGDGNRDWERSVEDNARVSHTARLIRTVGEHALRFIMVDPGVVLEKIVVDCGGVRPSYLGPPESAHGGPTR
ncbi:MAG TPA: glycosyl hydrolase 115 family protein [Bacteroidota bacterium]|nr:glycosyl hydrolase 115 family protein [Bacteroidota bacterium]